MPDGSPQTTPIWVDTDGEHVIMNTIRGRVKARNLERDPRISVAVLDPEKPYDRWVSVRGRAELIDEGAIEQIHALSRQYLGTDYPWLQPGEQRVIVKVHVERAIGPG
jgi:PPOX class probable F420-dependent enzyme